MIIKKVSDIAAQPLFFELGGFLGHATVYIKLEGLNAAGSIKLTTAKELIRAAKCSESFSDQTEIIESSSGNLGVALSILCKEENIPFTCVVDPNLAEKNRSLMTLYGAHLVTITKQDSNGGYLGSRIDEIHNRLKSNPHLIWLNQYANQANPDAHYRKTAPEIVSQFNRIDYLLIGAGTTGTLMGCGRYFKEKLPKTQVIAVDAVGSVTFGESPQKRFVPGIGTSRKPSIVNAKFLDKVIHVREEDGIAMCHNLLDRYGLLIGGSTGSVVHAIQQLREEIAEGSTVIAISPDLGDKYLETVFNDEWIDSKFFLGKRT